MPSRPPRPCRNCGRLLYNGDDCPDHPRPIVKRVYKPDDRPSSSARGYGWEWKIKVRDPFIAAHPWCADPFNEHKEKVRSQMIDHILPKPQGTDDASNLQALCFECHQKKGFQDGTRRSKWGRVKSS